METTPFDFIADKGNFVSKFVAIMLCEYFKTRNENIKD
jgi:hypothetical protein